MVETCSCGHDRGLQMACTYTSMYYSYTLKNAQPVASCQQAWTMLCCTSWTMLCCQQCCAINRCEQCCAANRCEQCCAVNRCEQCCAVNRCEQCCACQLWHGRTSSERKMSELPIREITLWHAGKIINFLNNTIIIIFPFVPSRGVGSGRLDTFLHSILSSTLSRSTTLPSSRTQPIHRFLGRPLLLVPGSLRSADHLTNSFSSILFTCPYSSRVHTTSVCILISSLSVLPPSIPALWIYIYIYIYIWWLACHWTYSPTY